MSRDARVLKAMSLAYVHQDVSGWRTAVVNS